MTSLLANIQDNPIAHIADHGEKSRKYCTFGLINISDIIESADRFIQLGAKICGTLNYELMTRQGIEFKEFTDVTPTRPDYLNQERVTIYYLTSEQRKNGCTSGLLDKAYSQNKDNQIDKEDYMHLPYGIDSLGGDYKTVYQEYVERACGLLGKDFIYTVNYKFYGSDEYREVAVDGIPFGQSVPYACHGLNHLSSYDKALSLFCFKPSPSDRKILTYVGEHFEYPNIIKGYIEERMYSASYQLCTRSKLRDFSETTCPITFVVPDIHVANYIKDNHIPDCVVKDDLTLYVPDRRGGHNIGFAGRVLKGDGGAKRAYSRFKIKFDKDTGREPTEEESYKWLTNRKEKQNDKINRSKML
jgi:hypothetical protein